MRVGKNSISFINMGIRNIGLFICPFRSCMLDTSVILISKSFFKGFWG